MSTPPFVTALKDLQIDQLSLEQVVSHYSAASLMLGAYKVLNIDPPPWLATIAGSLQKQANMLAEEQLEAELRRAEAELEGLKTPSERKADVKDRIRQLHEKLGR